MICWVTGTLTNMQMCAALKTMKQTYSQWLLPSSSLHDMQTSLENIDCSINSCNWKEGPVSLHQDTFFTPDISIKAYWPKWDPCYSGNIWGERAQAVLHGHTQKCQVTISNWQIPLPNPWLGDTQVVFFFFYNIFPCISSINPLQEEEEVADWYLLLYLETAVRIAA